MRTVPLLVPFLVTKLADACRSNLAMTRAVAGDGLGNFDELHGAPPPRRHCAAADGPPEGIETTETWTNACVLSVSARLQQPEMSGFQVSCASHLVLQSCHASTVES